MHSTCFLQAFSEGSLCCCKAMWSKCLNLSLHRPTPAPAFPSQCYGHLLRHRLSPAVSDKQELPLPTFLGGVSTCEK